MRHVLAIITTVLLLAVAGCGENPTQSAEDPTVQPDSTTTENSTETTTE